MYSSKITIQNLKINACALLFPRIRTKIVCDKIRVKVRVVDLVEYDERAMKHFTDAEVSLK